MSRQPDQFDDPALRDALRQRFGALQAPPALRQRICDLVAAESATAAIATTHVAFWRRPMFRIAAALLVAAAGVLAFNALRNDRQAVVISPTITDPLVSQDTVLAMLETHDRCTSKPDHRASNIPQDDWALMGQTIGRRLGGPVLAPDLEEDGWDFRGAAICPVGHNHGAHLVYARGGQSVSVFSLPPSCCAHLQPEVVQSECVNGHMVVSFATPEGLYTMVGHCPGGGLKLEEVQKLLARHRDNMVRDLAMRDARPQYEPTVVFWRR